MTDFQRKQLHESGKILLWTAVIIGGISIWAINQPPEVPRPIYTPSSTKQITASPTQTQYKAPSTQTFNGYACSTDCSGHEAGYEYAQDNDYTQSDVDDYSGNSQSFQEGMQSWVDEQCAMDSNYCN